MEMNNYIAMAANLAYRKMTVSRRTLPQVFLPGGFKCGTTFLYEVLRTHPNFASPFMNMKELYFLQDLPDFQPYGYTGMLKWLFDGLFGTYTGPQSYRKFFPTEGELRSIEKRTGHPAITGDFTPVNLYCPVAARRIRDLCPDAKLLIMLRDPVARAYSEYTMLSIRSSYERRSFEKAIAEELDGIGHGHYLADNYLGKGIYEPYINSILSNS